MKKLFGAVAIAAVLGAAGSAAAAPVQWTVGSGGNGHFYDWVDAGDLIGWTDSKTAAEAQGGYLATVTSAGENAFLVGISHNLGWLGGSDAGSEGAYTWRTGPEAGDALTFTAWNGGEPNNCCGGEDYLQLNWDSVGGWNDAPDFSGVTRPGGYFIEFGGFGVPEPATWAMMIGGFAGMGAMLRRRRTVAA